MENEQYDMRHGGPYDRGSADAYYQRPFNPHFYVGATATTPRVQITDENSEQFRAYKAGYSEQTETKDWG